MPDLTEPTPFPHLMPYITETAAAASASSSLTTITAGAQHVKGAWTQLIASTSTRCTSIAVITRGSSATAGFLVDIGTGAADAEVVLIPNIFAYHTSGTEYLGHNYIFLILVPASTRVAARCQSSTASATVKIACYLMEE